GMELPVDEEAASLWMKIGAPKGRVVKVPGLKENFWQMGDTGPCGPCSEIFYDMGLAASDQGHADCKFPCDCGRYVEIWNLVFMQYNRETPKDGIPGYTLRLLPKPSVDTGMGLERVTAVLENKISNFDTDLFQPLIDFAASLTRVPNDVVTVEESGIKHTTDYRAAFRIIADHSRAATFLISDGVIPSNEGRGYVLRKIIRRALVNANDLGAPTPFLSLMAATVRAGMKDAYPELEETAARVARVLDTEESQFTRTVEVGLKKLEEDIAPLRASELVDAPQPRVFPGQKAFKLYDTYGLPVDFINDVLRDQGLRLDTEGFDRAMQEQKTRAKASWKGAHKDSANPIYAKLAGTFKTEPDFYFGTKVRDARIETIVTKQGSVKEIKKGEEAEIVLDRTSIYSESGGQVADTGGLYDNSESLEVAEVRGAYYPVTGLIAHRVVAKEDLRVGDRVATIADADRRVRNMRNHTATHLLNAALRNILGPHVKQSGSLVAPDHLRFDFSHFAAVDSAEIAEIEQQVNEEILRNLEMRTDIMNIDDALQSGALAFFGDKYPEANVRVVTVADSSSPRGFYSKELCGGTHVVRTGEIGVFKIVAEQSTAAGIRRIEAITGDRVLTEYQRSLATLRAIGSLLNAGEDDIVGAVERQLESTRLLEKQLEDLKRKSAGSKATGLIETAREVKGVRVIAAQVTGVDREALRQMVDALRQKLGSGVVVLASADDGKVSLIAGVTKDLIPKLHAGKIIQELAKLVGGSGGGRPDLAEAGGKDTSGIEMAISQVYPLLDRLL
ncbi:MAG: alanine--tRNA ligase, partial [Candidatus Acidiferrales bacterium]